MSTFFNSLRFRLALLVIFSILPAIGLIVLNGNEDHRRARIEVQDNALRLANLVSIETEQTMLMTRQLLMSLTQFPAVRNRDTKNCSFLLESIHRIHHFYGSLLTVDTNGELVCSSRESQTRVNFGDRGYVRRAIEMRDFAISEYQIGRVIGKPILAFAHPIFDAELQVQGVAIASIDLSWLVRIASGVELPAGSVMTIIDSKGGILARWPDTENTIGVSIAGTELGSTILQQTAGVAETVGLDGIPRIYAFRPLLPGYQAGFVYVGVPQNIAYQAVNESLFRNLFALGIVLILALSAAVFFGHVFVMRGVTGLVNASKQLAAGNLEARTYIPSTSGEIGQLAGAFDEMASALQQREIERKRAEEEIKRNAERSQLLSEISEEFIRAGLHYAPVLKILVRWTAKKFGDTCVIHLLTDDGRLSDAAASFSADTDRDLSVRELSSFLSSNQQYLIEKVIVKGDSILIAGTDSHDSPLNLGELRFNSLLIVPMRADEVVVGMITMIRNRADHPLTAEDESFIQYLADRAAISIIKARLIQTVQQLNAELEERVKRRTAQLTAANKELEAFTYSVSHDLRAPLRAIDGFSRIIQEKYGHVLDSKGRYYLERTQTATQRMGDLIEDLLTLSKLTSTEMKWGKVDLSAIARDCEMELRECQPDRSVDFIIQEDLEVFGDEHLLRAALNNLLGNSWKFTAKEDHARIEFGMKMECGEQIFFVKDNGAGFDMAYADKLFGAFQRLHSVDEFPGTGIGLATVQRVIYRHGGTIWAEGMVNRGAAFYFKF